MDRFRSFIHVGLVGWFVSMVWLDTLGLDNRAFLWAFVRVLDYDVLYPL